MRPAGAALQSGFNFVSMILAVWVVCLCLDNSRTQRLERDREVNQSIARGLESGFVDWRVLMVCVIWTGSPKSSRDAARALGGGEGAERCVCCEACLLRYMERGSVMDT